MSASTNRTPSPTPSSEVERQRPPRGAPLDSSSLTWRYLADVRGVLLALRAGVLQVMHPSISAALVDHSDVFENPLRRLIRSAGPILGAVYDRDAEATARWVRERHPSIRGAGPRGHRYHALDPGTYYWAHATFFEAQIATQELFGTPFTTPEKEQLYAESITWYARYGLTMRPVPRDYEAFERYWQQMLEDVLEATPVALDAVQTMNQLPTPYPQIPGPAWATVRPLIGVSAPWLA
ncbi:MAG TPA: oxygenase MpaB family protein, partial [Solirubrobacteraceae bacterium]|nr:oxygenase MpaB family protein [Solirubrobacteraceae bacterium]